MRILLVEDHSDTAAALQRLLESTGHAVSVADSCAGAVEVASKTPIDLLICDIGLPDGDGMALLGELRKHYQLQGICLSGRDSEADIQESQSAGFAAHLTKPVDMNKLDELIRQMAAGSAA